MKMGKDIFSYLSKVKDLELNTDEGKVNYRWGLVLVALIVALTGTNWLLKGISFIIGTIKTLILKVNVVEPYEETNIPLLIGLTLIFFIVCIIILIVYDSSKKKTEKAISDEVNNPMEEL